MFFPENRKIFVCNKRKIQLFQLFQVFQLFHSVFHVLNDAAPNDPKRIVHFMLPFSGVHSSQIRNQINKLFSSTYRHIQIRCIFPPMQRLSAFFRLKGRIPLSLRPLIVYIYECQCCNALYVGETVRHFHKRISEHMGISAFTGDVICP